MVVLVVEQELLVQVEQAAVEVEVVLESMMDNFHLLESCHQELLVVK
jgi:hypothetical protein